MRLEMGEGGEGMCVCVRVCWCLVWVHKEAQLGDEIAGLVTEREMLYPIERGVP